MRLLVKYWVDSSISENSEGPSTSTGGERLSRREMFCVQIYYIRDPNSSKGMSTRDAMDGR